MDTDDLEPRGRRRQALETALKEDLSLLGLDELEERITLLESEIVRCRAEIASKRGSRDAAESIFKQ